MSHSLLKSTSVVSAMTFISRILGFFRDILAAQIFGVNAEVDAFMVAFKLPNFMRSLFAEGAFSQAFIPSLSHYRHTESPEKVVDFVKYITGSFGLILFSVTIIMIIFMPILVKINAPGFDAYRFHLSVKLCRITFGYLMLISLTALGASILNSYGKFAIAALTPALLNVVLIIAALFFAHTFKIPVESQAWGILIAGFVQFAFQLPSLKKQGFLCVPKINFSHPGVKRVLKLMIPAIFGASIVQIGVLINTIFASFLPTGSITWLYYSERLAYFPQGIFGVALATVVLPHLSRQHAVQSDTGFKRAMVWGIQCNLLIGVPASMVMGLLAGPLVATLFQYGKFSPQDVMMTRLSVMAYSVGLLGFMLTKLLSSAFYARSNIKTPVKIGAFAVVMNIILNALFIHSLKHAGLALATSLSACLNVLLLIYFLHQQKVFRFQTDLQEQWGWGKFLWRLLLANGAVCGFLILFQGHLSQWLQWSVGLRAFHLCFLMLSSIFIYLLILLLTGFRLKHFNVKGENA